MKRICYSAFLCIALAAAARAEQVRVVVAAPASTGETNAESQAALWQALVTAELSRHDWIHVLDRDDLSLAAQEWVQAARQPAGGKVPVRPAWAGADLLVIGELTITNDQISLNVRMLDAQWGAIAETLIEAFPPGELESHSRATADRLAPMALNWLGHREIHTLVSVVDFECRNPLPRSQWQDRALARTIRAALLPVPGVLVLERENVDALFTEARLQRGGFSQGSTATTNRWSGLRHYYLVSGSFHETQPAGQPLAISVTTHTKNLNGNQSHSLEEQYPFDHSGTGMSRLAARIHDLIVSTNGVTMRAPDAPSDRSAEAATLLRRAFELIHVPDVREQVFATAYAWELRPPAFNVEGHSDTSAARKANVLRAIQYARSAWIADKRNMLAAALLSTMLMDHQIGDTNAAVEIAEEVASRDKAYQRKAWFFLSQNTTREKSRYYRQLLYDQYSGSVEALIARREALAELRDKHMNDADVSAAVAEFRPIFDQLLSAEPAFVVGNEFEVNCLFELTQIGAAKATQPNKHDLRDPLGRALGTQLLEDMVAKHPERAFKLLWAWSTSWQRCTDDAQSIVNWLKRAVDAIPDNPKDRLSMGFAWDLAREQFAVQLMDQGRYQDALPYLLQIQSTSGFHAVERTMRIGRCEFELGDFTSALKQFEGLGPDNKEAAGWAAQCRGRLGAVASVQAARAFTISSTGVTWKTKPIPLPPAGITDIQQDGDCVWIGLGPSRWDQQSRELANNDPAQGSRTAGGLVQLETATGKTTAFAVGTSISYPWVTSLAIGNGCVWVGTYGKGIDVFDKATGRWSHFNETNGLPMNHVQCLDADADSLWVGTSHNRQGAVARYEFKTGEWQTFLPGDYPAKSGPPTGRILGVKSVAGNVWFLTEPESIGSVPVHRYDIKANQWTSYITTNFVVSMGAAADRVWFGPAARGAFHSGYEEALVSCKPDGTDWQTIRKQDGLPAFPIDAIAEHDRMVLLGGNGGTVMTLDPVKKHFTIFELPSKSWGYVTALQGVGDELWMGRASPQGQLQFLTP